MLATNWHMTFFWGLVTSGASSCYIKLTEYTLQHSECWETCQWKHVNIMDDFTPSMHWGTAASLRASLTMFKARQANCYFIFYLCIFYKRASFFFLICRRAALGISRMALQFLVWWWEGSYCRIGRPWTTGFPVWLKFRAEAPASASGFVKHQ